MQQRRARGLAAAAVCLALLVAGCSHTVLAGRALSMLYDPYRVAGLPVTDSPSGVRPNAPKPTGAVYNSDGGEIDQLAVLAVNDIEGYWRQHYSDALPGTFQPISGMGSFDSTSPDSPEMCGHETYQELNALYCFSDNKIYWDRGQLLPIAQKNFGDMGVVGVFAHEYGHNVQHTAKLVTPQTPVLVGEQQADCLAGVYLRWVAEGKSSRFTLSTGDGLTHVLAGLIASRDPTLDPDNAEMLRQGHGTALDRVSAFQIGFDEGTDACAHIDMDEINKRRGDLPMSLQYDADGDVQTGEAPIDNDDLSTLMDILGQVFSPANPPKLSTDPDNCADAKPSKPASYCPGTNTIYVDLPALQAMGQRADVQDYSLVKGDNTAFSAVISRYTLAVQHERGVPLTSATTGLRTACLTGVAQRKMAEPIKVSSGKQLVLAAGDIDEAVSGILLNGIVASDVDGQPAPAASTRIVAFRLGLQGEADQCFQRFS
ncbi:MAG TPA: neutral zinc metallopeptidase [Mycobacterium sp.]|nr:neutral zinc metallopeptidase [Mycobacterium sp.]